MKIQREFSQTMNLILKEENMVRAINVISEPKAVEPKPSIARQVGPIL